MSGSGRGWETSSPGLGELSREGGAEKVSPSCVSLSFPDCGMGVILQTSGLLGLDLVGVGRGRTEL